MSTQLVNLEEVGKPIGKKRADINATRYNRGDRALGIQITIHNGRNDHGCDLDFSYIGLNKNQAIILAESILEALK